MSVVALWETEIMINFRMIFSWIIKNSSAVIMAIIGFKV